MRFESINIVELLNVRFNAVDSNKQKLTTPEIVIQTMESKTDTKNDLVNAMRLLAKEGSMENADTVQIGNTVFLAHRGKDKNKRLPVMLLHVVYTAIVHADF